MMAANMYSTNVEIGARHFFGTIPKSTTNCKNNHNNKPLYCPQSDRDIYIRRSIKAYKIYPICYSQTNCLYLVLAHARVCSNNS